AASPPLERSLPPDVDVGERQDDEEEPELREPEPAELVVDDRERVEEHDLDVEDDEEHRRQVEADREPRLARRPGGHPGLERDLARACPAARALRQDVREDNHRHGDREGEQPVDEERKPAGEHGSVRPPYPLSGPWKTITSGAT